MTTLHRDRVRFILKKPMHGRRRFSILKDIVKPSGKRESKIVHDERLTALNAVLIAKQVGLHEAENAHTLPIAAVIGNEVRDVAHATPAEAWLSAIDPLAVGLIAPAHRA